MAAFVMIEAFVEHLAEGAHDLGADTLKIALTNTAVDETSDALLTDLTEITAENGYSSGGSAVTISSSTQTDGTYKLVLADLVFTASGGSFGPLRYAVLYNDTPSSPLNPLIGYWDFGSSVTIADTETFTCDFNATTGVLTIA